MLNKLEQKVNNKILEGKNENNKLKKEYNENLKQEISIRNLLDNIENIEKSKKRKRIIGILNIMALITSITVTPWILMMLLFLVISYMNEQNIIKENMKEIKNSDYTGSKRETDLKASLYTYVSNDFTIKEKIKDNNEKIDKYNKINEEIDYVKHLKLNVKEYNDDYFKLVKNLYKKIPALAFNSEKEYKNYLSHDNEFIKEEILNSKILSKHL